MSPQRVAGLPAWPMAAAMAGQWQQCDCVAAPHDYTQKETMKGEPSKERRGMAEEGETVKREMRE